MRTVSEDEARAWCVERGVKVDERKRPPLVFGWDFYIVPASAGYYVFGSHHEWIGFSARSEAVEATLATWLQDWNPERSRDSHLVGMGG